MVFLTSIPPAKKKKGGRGKRNHVRSAIWEKGKGEGMEGRCRVPMRSGKKEEGKKGSAAQSGLRPKNWKNWEKKKKASPSSPTEGEPARSSPGPKKKGGEVRSCHRREEEEKGKKLVLSLYSGKKSKWGKKEEDLSPLKEGGGRRGPAADLLVGEGRGKRKDVFSSHERKKSYLI